MSGSDAAGGFPLFSRLLGFVGGKQRASETKSVKEEPICNGIVKGYEVISDRRTRQFGNNMDDFSRTSTTFAASASGDFNLKNEHHRPQHTASVTRRGSLVLPRFKNVKREEHGSSTSLLVPNSPVSSSKPPPAYQTKYANFGHMPSVRLGSYSKPLFQPKSESRVVVKIAPPDPLRTNRFFEPIQSVEPFDNVEPTSTTAKNRKSLLDSYEDDLQESLSKRRKLFNTGSVNALSLDAEDLPIRRGLKRPALKESEEQEEVEEQHNSDSPSPSSFHSVQHQQTKKQKLQKTPVKLWDSTRNPIEVSMLSMKKYYERKNQEASIQSQENCSLHSSRESSIHQGPATEVRGLAEFSCSLTPSESVSLRGESGASTPLFDNVLDVGRPPRLSLISRDGSTKKRLTPCLEKDQQRMWAEKTSRKGISVKDYEEDRRHNESSKINLLIGTVGDESDGHRIEKRLPTKDMQPTVQVIGLTSSLTSTAASSMKLPSNDSAAESAKLTEAVQLAPSQSSPATTSLTLTSPATTDTSKTTFQVSTASFQMPQLVPPSQIQNNEGVTGSSKSKFPDIVASTPLNNVKQKESQLTSVQTESRKELAPQIVQPEKAQEKSIPQVNQSTSSPSHETRQKQGFVFAASNQVTQESNEQKVNSSAPATSTLFNFSTSKPLQSSFLFNPSVASSVAASTTTSLITVPSLPVFKPPLSVQSQPSVQPGTTGGIQQGQPFQTPTQNALSQVQDRPQNPLVQPFSFKTPALDSNLNKNTSVTNGTGTSMFKEPSFNLTSNPFSFQPTPQQNKVSSQQVVLSPMQDDSKMTTLFGSQQNSSGAAPNFFATPGQNSTQSSTNQLNLLFGTKQPVSEPSTLNFSSQQSNQKSLVFGQQNIIQQSNNLFSQKDSLFSTPAKQNFPFSASLQNDSKLPSSRSGTTSVFDQTNQSTAHQASISFPFGQQQQTNSQQSGSNLFKFGQQTTNPMQGDKLQVNNAFMFSQQQPISQQSGGGFSFPQQQQTNQIATSQPSAGIFNFVQQQQPLTNQQASSKSSAWGFNLVQQQQTNPQPSISQPSSGGFKFNQQPTNTVQNDQSQVNGAFKIVQQQQTKQQTNVQPLGSSSSVFNFGTLSTNAVRGDASQVNNAFVFSQQQANTEQQNSVLKLRPQMANAVQNEPSQVNNPFKVGGQQSNPFNFQSSASGMAGTTQNPTLQQNVNLSFGNTPLLSTNQLPPPGEKKSLQFGNNGGLNLTNPQFNFTSSNCTIENKGTPIQFGGTSQPSQAFNEGATNFPTVPSFTMGATAAQKPGASMANRQKRKTTRK